MEQGVRLVDPARFDLVTTCPGVRGELVCGRDVEIDVGCVFFWPVNGRNCASAPNCHVRQMPRYIAAGAVIHPFTHIDGEKTGPPCRAWRVDQALSPACAPARSWAEVHIGNFVGENSTLADGAKANHLAYLGGAARWASA